MGYGIFTPETTISGIASTGSTVLPVASTSAFPSSGNLYVYNTGLTGARDTAVGSQVSKVSYTGVTGTSFTGCTPASNLGLYNYAVNFPKIGPSFSTHAVRIPPHSSINQYDGVNANPVFSIEVWVVVLSNGGSTLGSIFNKGYETSSPPSLGYQMHVYAGNSSTVKLGCNVRHNTGLDADQATFADASGSGTIPLRRLTQVVMVYNRNSDKNIEAFVNGVQISSSGQAGTGDVVDDSGKALYIGNKFNGSIIHHGLVKQFRFYKGIALTPTQVAANYAGTPTEGASCYFPFNDFSLTGSSVDSVAGNVAQMITITPGTSGAYTAVTPETLPLSRNIENTVSHLPGAIVRGEQTVRGCPQCGTYLYK